MTGSRSSTLLDALHSELLGEVQALTANVMHLKAELPSITQALQDSAARMSAVAAKTLTDFEAMGHALLEVSAQRSADERGAAAVAHVQNARTTEAALERFTHYFWMLSALTTVSVAVSIVTVTTLLLRH